MIKSFRHKGLEELFRRGRSSKINPQHAAKLRDMMTFLDEMELEAEVLGRRWDAHKLTGKNNKGQPVQDHWSIRVSGNWRLTYLFTSDGDVVLLDYLDYH